MRKWCLVMMLFHGATGILGLQRSAYCESGSREKLNFNVGWKFIKKDVKGAENVGVNDKSWQNVNCPHTYNDIDTFDDWSPKGHVGELNQWHGKTWYRKHFTVDKKFQGKKVFIEFEAVRQVAEVYLNGKYLGKCENGFVPFGFDLTPHLKFGQKNVLALMCDNTFYPVGRDCSIHHKQGLPWNDPHWHPAHGGIYRNVYLHVVNPVHVTLPLYTNMKTVGTYVYAKNISEKSADLTVEAEIANTSTNDVSVKVISEIFDNDGKSVALLTKNGKVVSNGKTNVVAKGVVANPKPWEPDYPHIYKAVTKVYVNGKLQDSYETPFGIRYFRMDKKEGFFINGKYIKLVGWGQKSTNEWPGLGAAHPDWMHDFTLKMMKDAGANFIRWGHTAGGPVDIKVSDKYGIVTLQPGVDSEGDIQGHQWDVRVQTFRDMIIYYRNSPSILLWEGGNQSVSKAHLEELTSYVKQFDPNGGRLYGHRRANALTGSYSDFSVSTEGSGFRKNLPTVEGEYNREESPRRVWDNFSPPDFDYVGGKGQTYDLTSEQFAVNQVFQYRKIAPKFHCGGANWIFSDSTSGGRVACEVARASGEVDGVRLPKEAYYVSKVLFSNTPQVHIIGHWTYPASTVKDMFVASNCDEVELFVNGKSLGVKKASSNWNRRKNEAPYLFVFPKVKWSAGKIKAVARINGKEVVSQTKKTAGKPVAVKLTAITGPNGLLANGADVLLIDAEVVDKDGQRCPTFQGRIDFKTTGPGIWRGGYNSGRIKSINNSYLDLECGINRVAVRSTTTAGEITVTARVKDLKPAEITVKSLPFMVESGIADKLPVIPEQDKLKTVDSSAMTVKRWTGEEEGGKSTGKGLCLRNLSYSGPSGKSFIRKSLKRGAEAFSDRSWRFDKLPKYLVGADYIASAHDDRRYSALDLIQVDIVADCEVYVAHDDRLKRPTWLVGKYQDTNDDIVVAHTKFSLFKRKVTKGTSLTLGSNSEDDPGERCKNFMVFAVPEK